MPKNKQFVADCLELFGVRSSAVSILPGEKGEKGKNDAKVWFCAQTLCELVCAYIAQLLPMQIGCLDESPEAPKCINSISSVHTLVLNGFE